MDTLMNKFGNIISQQQQQVICYACHKERITYTCTRCEQTGTREDFQKANFKRDMQRGVLLCLECKEDRKKGKTCIVNDCKKLCQTKTYQVITNDTLDLVKIAYVKMHKNDIPQKIQRQMSVPNVK